MKRTKVWLDCDPGHDDAFAIMLAGHHPSLEVLGISTVAGNQTVAKTTANALKILSVSGLGHIDVVAGQSESLMRKVKICPEIHGNTGLDGPQFPVIEKQPIQKKAIIHMFEVISAQEEKVTLIATGALTNVALLFLLFPEVKQHIEQIVLMGGAIGRGNTHPVAEFNIEVDPEAAKIVLSSGLPITMVPIEVTHTALVTSHVLDRIQALNSKFGDLAVELLLFFQKTYREFFRFPDPPLHDPCAVAYVIDPSLFVTELMNVEVEISSMLCSGQTVCDTYHLTGRDKNVNVALSMDTEKFWNLMIEALKHANSASCLNSHLDTIQ